MESLSITHLGENQVVNDPNKILLEGGKSSNDGILIEKNHGNIAPAPNSMKGQVIQKNYILNDTAALRKKIGHEKRKEACNLGVEARDGSTWLWS